MDVSTQNLLQKEVKPLSKEWHRWLALGFGSTIVMSNYYVYDNPAALRLLLAEYLHFPQDEFDYVFGLLYSVYSLPNVFLPFLAGYFIHKFGTRYTHNFVRYNNIIWDSILSIWCGISVGMANAVW